MPTLHEYFRNDFKDLSLDATLTVKIGKQETGKVTDFIEIPINQRLQQHSYSSARLFTFYIPETTNTLLACKAILDGLEQRKADSDGIIAIGGFMNDITVGEHSTVYSNRVFFYHETPLNTEELEILDKIAKDIKVFLTLRSRSYLEDKIKTQQPQAFISHDSRDKQLIAKPLAHGLNSRLCFSWYDEFTLKVGDSLRESIEKGIKEAKKCVLILTPNFLNNPGWTKKEFNSIFTREMIFNERIVLPIWHN
ncbi:MAG: hypothetical protein ACJA2C_002346, partial [Marinoscillum sp.]